METLRTMRTSLKTLFHRIIRRDAALNSTDSEFALKKFKIIGFQFAPHLKYINDINSANKLMAAFFLMELSPQEPLYHNFGMME